MRHFVLVAATALMMSATAQAATKPAPEKPALPGTIHFGTDPATGKFKRLKGKSVVPRSAGTAELEHNARRDGTQKDQIDSAH